MSNNRVVCIGTFIQDLNQQLGWAKLPYRLRGMATDANQQGLGLGSALIAEAEKILIQKRCDVLWFNAREKAFHFYEKLGYLELDGQVTVAEFGPHKIMYKNLFLQSV